jgi:hypothetical protein
MDDDLDVPWPPRVAGVLAIGAGFVVLAAAVQVLMILAPSAVVVAFVVLQALSGVIGVACGAMMTRGSAVAVLTSSVVFLCSGAAFALWVCMVGGLEMGFSLLWVAATFSAGVAWLGSLVALPSSVRLRAARGRLLADEDRGRPSEV